MNIQRMVLPVVALIIASATCVNATANEVNAPSIFAIAANNIERIASPRKDIEIIRLTMAPQEVLSDHSTSKRVVITETALSIVRLEDEAKGTNVPQADIAPHRAFWLENTLSKGFRHVGKAPASYLAILWPDDYQAPETDLPPLNCTDDELLLDNNYTSVCLIKREDTERASSFYSNGQRHFKEQRHFEELRQSNLLFITNSTKPEVGYLVLMK